MKKRVLVDLDCTIVDMLEPLISTYNERFEDFLKMEDVKGWDLEKYAKHGDKIFDVMAEEHFFRDLQPYEGAVEGVQTLIDAGLDVCIVTAVDYRFPLACKGKAEWMQKHLPFIHKRRYVTAGDKWLIQADALIDDAPRNAIAYREHHPNAKIVGIEFPHNVDSPGFDFTAPNWKYPDCAWNLMTKYLIRELVEFPDRG